MLFLSGVLLLARTAGAEAAVEYVASMCAITQHHAQRLLGPCSAAVAAWDCLAALKDSPVTVCHAVYLSHVKLLGLWSTASDDVLQML